MNDRTLIDFLPGPRGEPDKVIGHPERRYSSDGGIAFTPAIRKKARSTLAFVIASGLAAGIAMVGLERVGLTSLAGSTAQPSEVAVVPAGIGALGRVEPVSRIRHLAPPSGLAVNRVARLLAHEGERVAAGQLLAEFADAAVKDSVVASAKAKVAESLASLSLVKAAGRPSQIEAQEARIASLAAQREIADRDAARSAALVPSGSGARAVAERDRAAAERAAAELQEARAQLATLRQARPEDVALAEAQLQTARAMLASAEAEAALSRIYAPIAGRVLKIYARPGDLVGANGLLDLANVDNLEVIADVYQTDLPRVRLGAPAEVSVSGESETYSAEVIRIGSLVKQTTEAGVDPVARVDGRTVEIGLALSPDSSRKLAGRIGMQVQVGIQP